VLPTSGLPSELGGSIQRGRSGQADPAKSRRHAQAILGTSGRRRVRSGLAVKAIKALTDLDLRGPARPVASSMIHGASPIHESQARVARDRPSGCLRRSQDVARRRQVWYRRCRRLGSFHSRCAGSAATRTPPRSALDDRPRRADDDCLRELRRIYDRRDLRQAHADLTSWLKRWQPRYARLTDGAEDASASRRRASTLLLRQHHQHLKSTDLLERLTEEIRRAARLLRIFPSPASGLRPVGAVCAEVREARLEGAPPHQHGSAQGAEKKAAMKPAA
jgi:hypothetical protein